MSTPETSPEILDAEEFEPAEEPELEEYRAEGPEAIAPEIDPVDAREQRIVVEIDDEE